MAAHPRVAVLGFHKIGPAPGGWDTWMYIPEVTFLAQLAWLHNAGWTVIDLTTFLRGLTDPSLLPERSALVTFDDACRSLRREALSCLRQFNDPAVVFVPTQFVGGLNQFDQQSQPDEAICDWADLRELHRNRMSVQSHAVSHRGFSTLTDAEIVDEVVQSKQVLERELGHAVEALAYPFGDGGQVPRRVGDMLSAAGYRAAFLYALDASPVRLPTAQVYQLDRIAMGRDTDLAARLS